MAEEDPIGDQEYKNLIDKIVSQVPEYLKLMKVKAELTREYYKNLVTQGFKDREALEIVSKAKGLTEI